MSRAYRLIETTGARATMGMVVLQVDETIERDAKRLLQSNDIALHVTRIPSGDTLTPDTIATMEINLPRAASLLPQAPDYDVVGYACTSGTTLIGADRVAELVRQGCAARAVTDPLTAAIAAFRQRGIRTIGLVSPYIESVAQPVVQAFETAGITVLHSVSFGEEVEANVVRIDPASTLEAARDVAKGVDAVFLSCTNLRTLDVISELERDLDCPVISSNTAMLWHMATLAGGWHPNVTGGTLFANT